MRDVIYSTEFFDIDFDRMGTSISTDNPDGVPVILLDCPDEH